MHIQNLPQPTRFIFWCTAPFLIATIVLLPILVRPPEASGWIVLGAVDALFICVLFGLYNPERFSWCWRCAGAMVFTGYLAYLASSIAEGQWFGEGRRSSATAINALIGLVVFGYPSIMYAVFGRFTWRRESGANDDSDERLDTDYTDSESN